MTMTNRKTILATLLAALAAAPLAVTPAHAQFNAPGAVQASHIYSQAELDQMLAPIALYPDEMLSQVLMASTYPIEVVEAARWSRAHPSLQGDDAVRAVQNEDWDPSVKSLVAFPQILQRMDERLEWTRSLGDAFLAQETQVMDQVQLLRHRAQDAGNLQSGEQIRVVQQGPAIVLEPAAPDYFYVPYYDPMEVYGTWWWPAYRPVAWSPWPGYARAYRPGYSAGFWWGRPVGLSVGFFFGNFDWSSRHARVAHANSYYYRAPAFANRSFVAERGRWQHDPQHRRGVDYRQAEVRQRFAGGDRQFARTQAQQVQPQAAFAPQRTEQRAERRDDRRPERQAQLEAQRQTRQQAQDTERRAQDQVRQRQREQTQARDSQVSQRRDAQEAERRQQQQAHRQAMDAQRATQQRASEDRRQVRQQVQEARQHDSQQDARRQAHDAQRAAQQRASEDRRQERQQRQEAPQQPRAERREQRQEHRKDHDKG